MSSLIATQFDPKIASALLCQAFEGGSNYWYNIVGYQEPDALSFISDADHAAVMERQPEITKHLDYPLNDGGEVLVADMNTDREYVLDLEACRRGWDVMARDHARAFLDAVLDDGINSDQTTGDIFLQCCLFGEVLYA